MFESFRSFDIDTAPGVTIHGVTAGSGPPLLLLHGFPQTLHIYHKVAPALTPHFTVVAIDIRGYGASTGPPASPGHEAYSKSAMAGDCVAVMQHLGHTGPFYVCGHDRGGRVAHALCVRHPDKVKRAILLDISPTKTMYDKTEQMYATAYFHWFFLIQSAPFPENMILADPEEFMGYCMGGRHGLSPYGGAGEKVKDGNNDKETLPPHFTEEAYAEYIKSAKDRPTVTAMCEDYRAAATVDLKEQTEDIENGTKIKCPLRVLWGASGIVGRLFNAVEDWKKLHATEEVSGEAVPGGHYIPEENSELLVQHIREFFVD